MRVIQYGVGAMGGLIARNALARVGVDVVGAIDADPAKVGRDLAEVLALDRPTGVIVIDPASSGWPDADVVLHSTSSRLELVAPNIEQVIARGLDMVSICEELAFPRVRHPELAARLDAAAKERGVTVLATGVNPGFAMDTLPIALTAVSWRVDAMTVTRVLDAGVRRLPFRQKVGVGLTREQFAERVAGGHFGHVGLAESAMAIAHALGWTPHEIERSLDPVMADDRTVTRAHGLRDGLVAGIHEVLTLRHRGAPVLTLDLTMAAGALDARDEVRVAGDPPIHVISPGGFHGDSSTAGIAVNAALAVRAAPPGLLTMRDIPPVHWTAAAG